jgi:hypothetical protein
VLEFKTIERELDRNEYKKTDLPTLKERTKRSAVNSLFESEFPFGYNQRNIAKYKPCITPSPLTIISKISVALIRCKVN